MILSKSQSFVLKIVLPIFAVAIVGANVIASNFSEEENVQDKIETAIFTKNERELCLLLVHKIDSLRDSYELKDYITFRTSYDDLDDYDQPIIDHQLKRKGTSITLIFERLLSENSNNRELGLMTKSLYREKDGLSYKFLIDQVESDFQYKNLLYSYWYQFEGHSDSAVYFMENEYNMFPSKENYFILFDLYERNEKIEKLKAFIEAEGKADFIGTKERLFLLGQREFSLYFKTVVKPIYSGDNLLLIFVSFLVIVVWIRYLKSLKFFKPVKWKYLVLTFFLSVVFSEATLVLYDLWSWLGVDENGHFVNDLVYYIVGVGFIEETVKLMSFLIVVFLFKKSIDEPVDYIVLASVSALGFAFGENILYYNSSFETIDSRAMTSTLLHMVLSSMVVYGYVIYKERKKSLWYFLGSFLSAVILHGLYDVFLGTGVGLVWVISMVLLLFGIVSWVKMTNNTLNISPFFSLKKIPIYSNFTIPLIGGLCGVVLLEYLYSVFSFGVHIANSHTLLSTVVSAAMISVVVVKVSKIKPVKGEWQSIKVLDINNFFNFEKYVDSKIQLVVTSGVLKGAFIKGVVEGQLNFINQKDFLIVSLVKGVSVNGKLTSKILIRPVRQGSSIFDPDVVVMLRHIKPEQNMEAESFSLGDFAQLGTGTLNEVHEFD